ncbi:P-loop containing nucleoside triphosphate hydrolase [Pseudocohnilembus persalinus]|uniref:p-loop containing nucleoside triphosphate hydrolase n=1 Tax=Pseudocohnilembus persalinus TaxID=266149 RepID=A0A0V0QDK2_PSEPJ|nr:P-loop containing nucleoside triphosphate hydrolase [Pseudocohnilembus persalinus]|eukprot:KRX00284.1 P-loop containing nucleoside triphosphate hydrolase [Pseudocohnilembus persalinus]
MRQQNSIGISLNSTPGKRVMPTFQQEFYREDGENTYENNLNQNQQGDNEDVYQQKNLSKNKGSKKKLKLNFAFQNNNINSENINFQNSCIKQQNKNGAIQQYPQSHLKEKTNQQLQQGNYLLTNSQNQNQDNKYMKVYVRLRPGSSEKFDEQDNAFEIKRENGKEELILKEDINIMEKIETYTYNKIFDNKTTQVELFESIMPPVFMDLLNKRNLQKMQQEDKNQFIFLNSQEGNQCKQQQQQQEEIQSLLDQFQNKWEEFSSQNCYHPVYQHLPLQEIKFYVSAHQIYNRKVLDLLSNNQENNSNNNKQFNFGNQNQNLLDLNKNDLNIHQDQNYNYFINGLNKIEIQSEQEGLDLIARAVKQRETRGTIYNLSSSRSHLNFRIDIIRKYYIDTGEGQNLEKRKEEKIENSMCFVDLAGAERYSADKNDNKALQQEAIAINEDLLCLQKCLRAMDKGEKPPVREKKLTKILSQYFNPETNLVMCTNIHPSSKFISETKLVLSYSNLAYQSEYQNWKYYDPLQVKSNKQNNIQKEWEIMDLKSKYYNIDNWNLKRCNDQIF